MRHYTSYRHPDTPEEANTLLIHHGRFGQDAHASEALQTEWLQEIAQWADQRGIYLHLIEVVGPTIPRLFEVCGFIRKGPGLIRNPKPTAAPAADTKNLTSIKEVIDLCVSWMLPPFSDQIRESIPRSLYVDGSIEIDRLANVLHDLIQNAFDASPNGIVEINAALDSSMVALSIENPGRVDSKRLNKNARDAVRHGQLFKLGDDLYREESGLHPSKAYSIVSLRGLRRAGIAELPFIRGLGIGKEPHEHWERGHGLALFSARQYIRSLGGTLTLATEKRGRKYFTLCTIYLRAA